MSEQQRTFKSSGRLNLLIIFLWVCSVQQFEGWWYDNASKTAKVIPQTLLVINTQIEKTLQQTIIIINDDDDDDNDDDDDDDDDSNKLKKCNPYFSVAERFLIPHARLS